MKVNKEQMLLILNKFQLHYREELLDEPKNSKAEKAWYVTNANDKVYCLCYESPDFFFKVWFNKHCGLLEFNLSSNTRNHSTTGEYRTHAILKHFDSVWHIWADLRNMSQNHLKHKEIKESFLKEQAKLENFNKVFYDIYSDDINNILLDDEDDE